MTQSGDSYEAARPIKLLDVVLLLALIGTPVVGVLNFFQGKQADYRKQAEIGETRYVNSRLSLERARSCNTLVLQDGATIVPTMIGLNPILREDKEDDGRRIEGQYMCALDGSTARVISRVVSEGKVRALDRIVVVANDRDLRKYQEILARRGLISESQIIPEEN